jgi:hypothetical protein
VKPEEACRTIIAQYDHSVRHRRDSFEKPRDEFAATLQVDPTEAWNAKATVGVNVNQSRSRSVRSLKSLAERRPSYSSAAVSIRFIVRILDGPIITCKQEQLPI